MKKSERALSSEEKSIFRLHELLSEDFEEKAYLQMGFFFNSAQCAGSSYGVAQIKIKRLGRCLQLVRLKSKQVGVYFDGVTHS